MNISPAGECRWRGAALGIARGPWGVGYPQVDGHGPGDLLGVVAEPDLIGMQMTPRRDYGRLTSVICYSINAHTTLPLLSSLAFQPHFVLIASMISSPRPRSSSPPAPPVGSGG